MLAFAFQPFGFLLIPDSKPYFPVFACPHFPISLPLFTFTLPWSRQGRAAREQNVRTLFCV